MIKDSNKYLRVKVTKEQDKQLKELSEKSSLSVSNIVGLAVAAILAEKGGELLGDSIGKLLFGKDKSE